MDNTLAIPHFGRITVGDAVNFIQQMLEYNMLHDGMKGCSQEAHVRFVSDSMNDEAKEAVSFFTEHMDIDCSIITDLMLHRCRELMKKTE